MRTGIESINFYGGPASISARSIFEGRGLDLSRFDNLMMDRKSVGVACEDAVTNGVNAAKPIIDALSDEEKNRIELVITASESGVDFGKSLSTYIHDYLGLGRNCRLFELKQACYGGTAGLHMAACFVASNVSPGAKALVIATDVARAAAKSTYGEPSQAVGAIAMLISDKPDILELDFGATGQYSYEVMDTCRPLPEIETGNPDLSLLSYLDCLENSYKNYKQKVEGVHFLETFDYLAFHTPFGGMVKGAHRKLMHDEMKLRGAAVQQDFDKRVAPALIYGMQVGNVYSAALYLGLCSLIDHAPVDDYRRVGLFSYGSGCSSEFYSGVIGPDSAAKLGVMNIGGQLDSRYELSFDEYEQILDQNVEWLFGIRDKKVDFSGFSRVYEHFFKGKGYLVLTEVDDFHRKYAWS
ncbi:3-hydroxy-3-methylglutaryl-ACP synthase [Paenibacillus sp. FSL R7-0273]|uniref:hydroxymethylglutaryl-CoA synthase family protein n=1 Tax=Paenibacillus sp. FSL R7-0273 TaxID=1536772 RepID=UPI0004F9050E|nr:hydroxymethylglutaryl-CoA synthase [Paenibacillus sp. FSL R7-0273]AIQ47425.1 3-hydroxy-3-methylglutaryl-ACP synthase [Paenibacillus sp. FSL R7-0273]OMF96018.1 3-hydroxy-3-methylglutaryl-ACP synthase [Paenibacillus sp. FSL R7-0273]